jgi:SnoaL-like domain
MTDLASLTARIDRLESIDQIRQLPAKYALCVDMRDMDALANLFVDDVYVSKTLKGRQAIKQWYDSALRTGLIGSAHGIHGHIIDIENADFADGLVYSRNDLEQDDVWMMEVMAYLDRYERRDGIWYFQRRTPLFWFQCDHREPPIGGGENKLRWNGREWAAGAFHDAFPSWQDWWDEVDVGGTSPVKPPAPLGKFLAALRRGEGMPKVRARTDRDVFNG